MKIKNMNRKQFEKWWFEGFGEEISFEKYRITKKDIKKQPSFPSDNAITEAIWEKAFTNMVK